APSAVACAGFAGTTCGSAGRALSCLPCPSPAGCATIERSGSSGVRVVSFSRDGDSWWPSEQLGFARVVFGVAGNGQQRGGIAQVHQAHPLRLPACLAHLASRGTDHPTRRGDRVQLVVDVDDERPDQRATPAVVLDGQDTLATP